MKESGQNLGKTIKKRWNLFATPTDALAAKAVLQFISRQFSHVKMVRTITTAKRTKYYESESEEENAPITKRGRYDEEDDYSDEEPLPQGN